MKLFMPSALRIKPEDPFVPRLLLEAVQRLEAKVVELETALHSLKDERWVSSAMSWRP